MKTNVYSRYSYKDLRARLDAEDRKQIDIDTLGAWFSEYCPYSWNGECYDADGVCLRPVIRWDETAEQGEIVGYEIV